MRRLRSGSPREAKLWNSTWARLTENDWASIRRLLHPLASMHDHLDRPGLRIADDQIGNLTGLDGRRPRHCCHDLAHPRSDLRAFRHRHIGLRTDRTKLTAF